MLWLVWLSGYCLWGYAWLLERELTVYEGTATSPVGTKLIFGGGEGAAGEVSWMGVWDFKTFEIKFTKVMN